MSEICPKCGATNQSGQSTCIRCGAELEIALFAEMFGPPRLLKGRYATQRPIRQGSAVSLYRARDTKDGNRPCLIHQVSLTALDRDRQELIEHRFLQEAATWQTRQHPNIIRILDADVQHHRLYLITEPIVGTSLRSIIRDRRQAIPEATMAQWAGQLCDALHYLHTLSPPVVLGCISPATIHVDAAGRLQLIEVGLIRYRQSGLIGPARGVSGYAAPEQRKGQVTPRSDLYTVGIILYQIITRHDPRDRPLPSLRKQASSFADGRALSASFISAVARAYRRDPEKRFASAAEMREAIMGASPQPVFELAPLELEAGTTVNTLPALVGFCATHWEEGLSELISGRIVEWLSTAAEALRHGSPEPAAQQVDSLGPADKLRLIEQAAQRAAEAQRQMIGDTTQARRTAAARDIARNATYAAWLQDMGAVGIQPSLQVRPLGFDFGVVGATIKAKSTLHIQNRGQGYLTGRVDSRVPWLTVPNPLFGCRAGETAEIPVEARGRNLQAGESHSPQALRVLSNGGEVWIEARASSSPPILSVHPQTLDYGPITRGASRIVQLTVANRGGGRLSGQVLSQAPYLRVRYPNFSCSTGASAQIDVELLSDRLPRGAVRIRKALAVDSDSGQARVDVAWKWARPALELDTTGLDLGSVRRGAQIERTLTLSNGGTADLVGTARSQVDWLTVLPVEFRCAPGATQTLTVLCDTRRLPGGSTVEPEALVIEANADTLRRAGRQVLSASIEVLAARLIVEPSDIDLGTVLDGEAAEETLVVGNRGSLPWEGRIRTTVPWLIVEPDDIRCDPGHFVPVSVLLKTEELETGGKWHMPQAILIGEGEQQQGVAVHVALIRPQLDVERRNLDFGLIGRTEVETLPLQITNSGTGQLEWRIGVRGTWLEVLPSEGTCDAGETATVQVNAYALAVDGDSERGWLTVHSNGGRVDMPASVALSSPALSVEPLTVELESENYAEAVGTIRLSNQGVGLLSGTIRPQVPWLTCAPQTFTCTTGAATQIQISANLEHLRAHEQVQGIREAADALVVDSNAGTQEIGARLTLLLTAHLHVAPQELRLQDATDAEFQLENQGYGTLRVHLAPSEPWITVNRQEWTIKARKRARVRVRLVDAPENGQGSIEIRTPDTVARLPVRSAG